MHENALHLLLKTCLLSEIYNFSKSILLILTTVLFNYTCFLLQDWLSKFGYLPPPDPVNGQLQTKEALTRAIKAMQRFGGLEETGVLG